MNKKGKKLLALCLVISVILTQILATNLVFAATRVSGADRYQTALAASNSFKTATTVVLASGEDDPNGNVYPDALAAVPYAASVNAPILLTQKGALTAGVLDRIKALGATNVVIAGGTGAVSQAVADSLTAAGLTVARVAGADRYTTSLAFAQKLASVKGVFIVNGDSFADALSVSSIAAVKGYAVVLVAKDPAQTPADVMNFLSGKTVYAVGGSGVLADGYVTAGATRLSGADRYATNLAVLKQFAADLKFTNVYVATGEKGADALTGSVVAGLADAPVVLVGSSLTPDMAAFLGTYAAASNTVTVLGGTGAVADSAASAVQAAATGTSTTPTTNLTISSVSAINATTVEAVFNGAASADQQKGATFTVTKTDTNNNTATLSMTATFSADGTKADLTTGGNLMKGTYTVAGSGSVSGQGSVTVDDQKIGKITILGTKVYSPAGSTTAGADAIANYKIYDQYGTDVTGTALENTMSWSCSYGTLGNGIDTDHNGKLTITKPGTGASFSPLDTIIVTGYDTNTGVSTTANMTWALYPSVSNITFGTPVLPSGSTDITTQASNACQIPVTITDEFGNTITNVDQLATNGAIMITSSDSAVAVDAENDIDGNVYLQVSTQQLTLAEPVQISLIAKANGKSFSTTINVVKSAKPYSVTFGALTSTIAAGDTGVVLPITVNDQNGKTLSTDDLISNVVDGITSGNPVMTLTTSSSLVKNLKIAQGGSHRGSITFDVDQLPTGSTSQNVTVSAFIPSTGKMATISFTVMAARYPASVAFDPSMKSFMVAAPSSSSIGAKISVNAVVKDQYGDKLDPFSYTDPSGTTYTVTAQLDPKGSTSTTAAYLVDGNKYLKSTTVSGVNDTVNADNTGAAWSNTVKYDSAHGSPLSYPVENYYVPASNSPYPTAVAAGTILSAESTQNPAWAMYSSVLDSNDNTATFQLEFNLMKQVGSATPLSVAHVDKTITVAKNTGLTYSVSDIPTLAGDKVAASTAKTANYLTSADAGTVQSGPSSEARSLTVTAKDAAGNVYAVPNSLVYNVTSSDTTIANVAQREVLSTWYVAGKDIATVANSSDFVGTKTANITVNVMTDAGPVAITKPVTVDSHDPQTNSIVIVDRPTVSPYGLDAMAGTISNLDFATATTAKKGYWAYSVDQYGVYRKITGATFTPASPNAAGLTLTWSATNDATTGNPYQLQISGTPAAGSIGETMYFSITADRITDTSFKTTGSGTVGISAVVDATH